MELKVGDRVKLRKSSRYYNSTASHIDSHGIGTIVILLDNRHHKWGIKWDSMKNLIRIPDADCFLREVDIELSRVKATRLSRKIYPKSKVSECGEWIEI